MDGKSVSALQNFLFLFRSFFFSFEGQEEEFLPKL